MACVLGNLVAAILKKNDRNKSIAYEDKSIGDDPNVTYGKPTDVTRNKVYCEYN